MTLPFGSESGLALELFATVLVRGAALVATAWIATRLVGSAGTRRTGWIALFVVLAATPLLVLRPAWVSMAVGESPVARATASVEPIDAIATSAAPARTAAPERRSTASTAPFEPAAGSGPDSESPLARIVIVAWLAGVLVLLIRMLAGRRGLAAVASRGREPGERLAAIARAELERAGLERPVRVILTDELAVPASWGYRRPVVALPVDAGEWPDERARIVLRHDVTHVRRRDALALSFIRLTRALYWPNPLVWWAARRARDAQEGACDAIVLGTGVRGVDYARHLVDVARTCADRGSPIPEAALTIDGRERLERRVRSILSARPAERRCGLVAVVTAALVLVAAPVTGVRVEPIRDRIVATTLDELGSPKPAERQRAASRLAEVPDRRARPALEDRLDDPDPAVRRAAARAVDAIDPLTG